MTSMDTIVLSPKYQVVIPRAAREKLRLKPGQKIQVVVYGDRLELIPQRALRQMRGFLRGIATDVPRDGDRV
jgi:AbrB family looped-hinge helix DNA binding protein